MTRDKINRLQQVHVSYCSLSCLKMSDKKIEEFYEGPAWLTKDYIEDKLQKYQRDKNINIIDLEVKPGTAKGENYASVMTRINIVYNSTRCNNLKSTYLVKTTYKEHDPCAHFFGELGVYTREMDAYENVLPKLAALLREIGDNEPLYANTMCVDRVHTSIIFEDLSLENYKIVDRIERMDVLHTRLALRKLAKLHAAAAVLNERSPGIFAKNYDRAFFTRGIDGFKPVITCMLNAIMRYLEKEPQLKAKYYDKLAMLRDNIMEYGARVYDVNETHFMTLTHGDFWTTNIMFKYQDNSKIPTNVIPIDYQYSTWGSPAIDLQYFFNTSLREELRLHHQHEFVQYYYYILADTLRRLNYHGHIPSLNDFYLQFEERSFLGLFASFVFQPFMIYNGDKEASWENILLDNEPGNSFRDALFENENVQKNLQRLLPIFDRKGLLDIMD